MAIQVLGIYPTEQEAVNAVDVHALGGLLKENMTILANEEHVISLEDQTSVTVKANKPIEAGERESEGVMEKLKEVFTPDDDFELHSEEQLVNFGLKELEAKHCMEAVENGKIVVLADDDMRMGHDETTVINDMGQ